MRKLFYTLVAVVLFVVAYAEACFACGIWGYQPQIPEKIRR